MTMSRGDWQDILTVIHETYRIWSPGLTRYEYQDYMSMQLRHAWSRKNFRVAVFREGNEIAAACKLYEIGCAARGKSYRLRGLGALYTMLKFRKQGYASKLIESVIEEAKRDGIDAVILYSDIGSEFYEQFGFEEFSSTDFFIHLPGGCHSGNGTDSLIVPSRVVEEDDVTTMVRYYGRWLRSQPFAVERSGQYLSYKLQRERYLNQHSHLNWPPLEVTLVHDELDGGYMLSESAGSTLRILEMIGSERVRLKLWHSLFARAKKEGLRRIRGWESAIRDFAPRFCPESLMPEGLFAEPVGPMHYVERDWGRGMMLVFNDAIEDWTDAFPCPLLEIDHL